MEETLLLLRWSQYIKGTRNRSGPYNAFVIKTYDPDWIVLGKLSQKAREGMSCKCVIQAWRWESIWGEKQHANGRNEEPKLAQDNGAAVLCRSAPGCCVKHGF